MNGNSEIRGQEIFFQEIADIHYSEEYFSSVIFFMWGKKYLCSGAIVGILYAITVDDCADKIVLRPHVFAYSFYKTEAVNEFGHIEYSTGDLAFVEGIGKLQLVMVSSFLPYYTRTLNVNRINFNFIQIIGKLKFCFS